jgi:hypothetical protein
MLALLLSIALTPGAAFPSISSNFIDMSHQNAEHSKRFDQVSMAAVGRVIVFHDWIVGVAFVPSAKNVFSLTPGPKLLCERMIYVDMDGK